jgi:hypothetical protein
MGFKEITTKDILGDTLVSDVPIAVQHNIEEIKARANGILAELDKKATVTSGFRTLNKHLNIYRRKGIFPPHVPMGSLHLAGAAIDLLDLDGELYRALHTEAGAALMAKYDLYGELDTKGWVHLQCKPFRSYKKGGTRWFRA